MLLKQNNRHSFAWIYYSIYIFIILYHKIDEPTAIINTYNGCWG